MSDHPWTFVSSFFNLDAYQAGNRESRKAADYVKQASSTLQIPVPLVLFLSRSMMDAIKPHIDARPWPTVVIPIDLEDLQTFRLYPQICANRQAPAYKPMYDTSRNTPSFCVTVVGKFELLALAAHINPFASSMFAWIDFHYGHCDPQFSLEALQTQVRRLVSYPIDYWPADKYHFGLIDWIPTSHFHNKRLYYSPHGLRTTFAGGFHFGARSAVNRVCSAILKEFEETVGEGLGHAEEQLMYYVVRKNPSWFRVFPCDYYSIIFNALLPTRDIGCTLRNLLPHLLADGQTDLVRSIVTQLTESAERGLITLPSEFYTTYW